MKYISKDRIRQLEDSMGWLTHYITPKEETHVVGESLEQEDEELTKLLHEMGELNKRRYEILNKFKL